MKAANTVLESFTTTNIFTLEAVAFGHDKITGNSFLQVRFNGQDFNFNFDYNGIESGVIATESKEVLAMLYDCNAITYSLDENGMIRASRKGKIADINQNRYIALNEAFVRRGMDKITPSDMQQISEFLTMAVQIQFDY